MDEVADTELTSAWTNAHTAATCSFDFYLVNMIAEPRLDCFGQILKFRCRFEWSNDRLTEEHGQCVVRDGSRKDDAPKATATAASSSRQPESKACQAEFEVLDDLGCVLATQKPDGRVYKTGFAAPLGEIGRAHV